MGIRSQGVELGRGGDWFEPTLNIHTPLSPPLSRLFYLPLFNPIVKKLFLIKNTGEG